MEATIKIQLGQSILHAFFIPENKIKLTQIQSIIKNDYQIQSDQYSIIYRDNEGDQIAVDCQDDIEIAKITMLEIGLTLYITLHNDNSKYIFLKKSEKNKQEESSTTNLLKINEDVKQQVLNYQQQPNSQNNLGSQLIQKQNIQQQQIKVIQIKLNQQIKEEVIDEKQNKTNMEEIIKQIKCQDLQLKENLFQQQLQNIQKQLNSQSQSQQLINLNYQQKNKQNQNLGLQNNNLISQKFKENEKCQDNLFIQNEIKKQKDKKKNQPQKQMWAKQTLIKLIREQVFGMIPLLSDQIKKGLLPKQQNQNNSKNCSICYQQINKQYFYNYERKKIICCECQEKDKGTQPLIKIRSLIFPQQISWMKLIQIHQNQVQHKLQSQPILYYKNLKQIAIKRIKDEFDVKIQLLKKEKKKIAEQVKQKQKQSNKKKLQQQKNKKQEQKKKQQSSKQVKKNKQQKNKKINKNDKVEIGDKNQKQQRKSIQKIQ